MGLGIETEFDFCSSLDILVDDDCLEGRLAERGERQDFDQGSEPLKSSDIEKRRFSERFVDPERGIEKLLVGFDRMSPSPEMLTCQLETNRVFVALFGRFSYPSTPPTATFQVKATRLFSTETDGAGMLPSSSSTPSRSRPSCSLDGREPEHPGSSILSLVSAWMLCPSYDFQLMDSETELVRNGNETCS